MAPRRNEDRGRDARQRRTDRPGHYPAALREERDTVISLGGWHTLAPRMAESLSDYHAQYPLRPGMGREELKGRIQGRDKWFAKPCLMG